MQSIRERSFSGPDGLKFAKLYFPREDMIMMIRGEDISGMIRKPIAKSTARKVLEHIREWSETVSDQWKVRANAQQQKLDDGDPFGLAEVYKTLVGRQKADCLSAADRRQLGQSEKVLSEELAIALELPVVKVLGSMKEAACA